jgi:hypothetical protein
MGGATAHHQNSFQGFILIIGGTGWNMGNIPYVFSNAKNFSSQGLGGLYVVRNGLPFLDMQVHIVKGNIANCQRSHPFLVVTKR